MQAKIIICVMLAASLLLPGLAVSQDADTGTVPTTWKLILSRNIVWMGDTFTAVVNGSRNTTVVMELRLWNATSSTYENYSWRDTCRTDINGTGILTVDTEDVEKWGNYSLVALVNNVVMSRTTVTINYDPLRWLEILIERNTAHDDDQDASIQLGVERDATILDKLGNYQNLVYALLLVFIIYFLLTFELYMNYHIWKAKKAGRRVRATWFMSDDNSEFFSQGGIMWDRPPKLPKTVNGTDMTGSGLVGKDTREIIKDINSKLGKGVSVTIRKMAPATEKSRWRRKKERKEIVSAGEEPKPATYLDLYKGD